MRDLASFSTSDQKMDHEPEGELDGDDESDHRGMNQETVVQGSWVEEGSQPRLWSGDFTAITTLCLFCGSAIVVICIPFLPQRHSNKSFDSHIYLVRDAFLVILCAISIVSAANMVRKKDKFHELGLALWP